MKKLLITAAALLALTTSVQAQSLEPTASVYRLVRGAHILDFYDRTCKPGSLSSTAKKLVKFVIDSSPSDFNSRITDEITAKAKERGSAYCVQLERELKIDSFNASAEKPDTMKSAKAELDRFLASKGYDLEVAQLEFKRQQEEVVERQTGTLAGDAEDDRDNAAATVYGYAQHCIKLPTNVMNWADTWAQTRPAQVGIERRKVEADYHMAGTDAWCDMNEAPLRAYFKFEITQFQADSARSARKCFDTAPKNENGIIDVMKYQRCYYANRQQNLRADLERKREESGFNKSRGR